MSTPSEILQIYSNKHTGADYVMVGYTRLWLRRVSVAAPGFQLFAFPLLRLTSEFARTCAGVSLRDIFPPESSYLRIGPDEHLGAPMKFLLIHGGAGVGRDYAPIIKDVCLVVGPSLDFSLPTLSSLITEGAKLVREAR